MDEARLSQRERRILAEIEQALGHDDPLDRSMRTMGRRRRIPGLGVSVAGVVLLGAVTVTLLVLAVATAETALVWAFAAAWVLTLVCLLRLVMAWAGRWSARRAAVRAARDGDGPSAGD
ncbi:DUF3040 domain-containing protein [Streptomyces sp.]|uniref:DUF3040 domain-containing protein n=1 Tax=Streptomyces sp. TaxID=1931 RepID=UPI002F94F252